MNLQTFKAPTMAECLAEVKRVMGTDAVILLTRVRQQESHDIPPELFDEYMLLIENQVERELAAEIIKGLHRTLRPDHLTQKPFVREKIADQLEKLLPTAGPIARSKAFGPH